jgi:hypothetical protein
MRGAARDLGALTINVKNVDGNPLGGGTTGDPGASTINIKIIDGGPWEVMSEDPGVSTINTKTSSVDPLGGDVRRCRSVHH